MSSDERFARGECYLIIECYKQKYGPTHALRIDRVTQRKPALGPDEVALRVDVALPVALFLKPTLSASIRVDGEAPTFELDTETVTSIEDLLRTSVGLDVVLNVMAPDDD